MEYTKIGKTDIEVSKVCVGCMINFFGYSQWIFRRNKREISGESIEEKCGQR